MRWTRTEIASFTLKEWLRPRGYWAVVAVTACTSPAASQAADRHSDDHPPGEPPRRDRALPTRWQCARRSDVGQPRAAAHAVRGAATADARTS